MVSQKYFAKVTLSEKNIQQTHISGVLDLFFPLKNSGRARLSISWMLKHTKADASAGEGGGGQRRERAEQRRCSPPVVVEPGAVTGDDDVVRLLCHVVLAGVHQPVCLRLAMLLVVLQVASQGGDDNQMIQSK